MYVCTIQHQSKIFFLFKKKPTEELSNSDHKLALKMAFIVRILRGIYKVNTMNDPKKYKHPNCASKSHLKCKVARCTYLLYLFLYCVDAIVIIQMWVLNILYFQCNSTYGYLCTSKCLHLLILY